METMKNHMISYHSFTHWTVPHGTWTGGITVAAVAVAAVAVGAVSVGRAWSWSGVSLKSQAKWISFPDVCPVSFL